jgi:MFS family permease
MTSNYFLFLIFLIMASESFSLGIINPYIKDLLTNHYNISDNNVPLYAGLISGIYNIAVFISAIPIGYFSDLYGKEKFVLLGIGSLGICNLFFSITTNVYLAAFLRFLAGLLNTNDSLCKAMIADQVSNSQERTLILALSALGFQFFRSLSMLIGIFTVGVIVFNYQNPYFLPSLIGSIFDFILFCIYFVILIKTKSEYSNLETNDNNNVQEEKPNETKLSFIETVKDIWKLFLYLCSVKTIKNLFIISFLNNFISSGILLLFTLIINDHSSTIGFGFSTIETGVLLIFYGICCGIFQFVSRYLKTNKYQNFYLGISFSITACFLLGLISYFRQYQQNILSWMCLVFYILTSSSGYMIITPSISSMMFEETDKFANNKQGTVQGIARCLSAISKGLGPIILGSLSTVLRKYDIHIVMNFILICLYIFCCFIMTKSEVIESRNDQNSTDHVIQDIRKTISEQHELSLLIINEENNDV